MPARTFTSAGVNNLWSNAANWDGGVTIPAEDDSVTIPTGQTCEYDYNSAYTTGIAGITITGTGKLMLTRTTGTYKLFMKAATTITGTGTFDCGASAGDAIPFAAKHTITGGAGWYITGTLGLTMTVYAAEPAIKVILQTALEPIGETVIAVDTDVTGDIWADGDTIRINDINQAQESEERVIAAGGIAAGTITITAGLTAAKSIGAVVCLVSRNLKFIGVGATGIVAKSFAANKLTIAGGQWTTANYSALTDCTTVAISGGSFHACAILFDRVNTSTISGGVFSGNSTVIYNSTAPTLSGGSFYGNSSVINNCNTSVITGGTYKGNGLALNTCISASISGGTFIGNGTICYNIAVQILINGTFTSNGAIFSRSAAVTSNVVFTGSTAADISASKVNAVNVLFGATTENSGYTSLPVEAYSESLDHDQSVGAYKAWTRGGITSSQAGTVPVGYTSAMQTVLESATQQGYWQKEVLVTPGASVNITMNLRKSASMTYLPRCIIFNKASTDPFAGGAGIHTFTMTNSVDTWEAETYTYYNSTANDVTLVVRFQGMNASGNMFSALSVEQINVDLTSALAAIAAIDTDVMNYVVEGAYTLQDVLKFMAGVLAGKSSGGGTATITFRDLSDSLDRVQATVTAAGNRTAVTLNDG
jgi:hypothetical protein